MPRHLMRLRTGAASRRDDEAAGRLRHRSARGIPTTGAPVVAAVPWSPLLDSSNGPRRQLRPIAHAGRPWTVAQDGTRPTVSSAQTLKPRAWSDAVVSLACTNAEGNASL